jgi:antibiotic biosynthesis monooxygenase (ABM) superfamily enzyme
MPDTPATETATPAGGLPVTVVLSSRPAPGREDDLVAWAHGISDAASSFPGHLGAVVYPPSSPDCDDLVLVFSFADADRLKAWEGSELRREWLERSRPLVAGEVRAVHAASGFEGIFSHAPGQAVTPPPRWKTATIIALALYPVSLLLNWLLGPHIAGWNLWLRVLLNVAIIVPYMAWVGVPYLTKWLRGWLHA